MALHRIYRGHRDYLYQINVETIPSCTYFKSRIYQGWHHTKLIPNLYGYTSIKSITKRKLNRLIHSVGKDNIISIDVFQGMKPYKHYVFKPLYRIIDNKPNLDIKVLYRFINGNNKS
jgi:hypothetical protein